HVRELRHRPGRRRREGPPPPQPLVLRAVHSPDGLAAAGELLLRLGLPGAGLGPLRRVRLLPRLRQFPPLPQEVRVKVPFLDLERDCQALDREVAGAWRRVLAAGWYVSARRSRRWSRSSRPTAASGTASASATAWTPWS